MSMKEKLHRWLQKNLKCAKNPEIKSWVLVGNRFSLLFHGLWAVILCFTIEIFSRRSVKGAWDFIADSPLAFLYNGLLVFVTFMPVYFFRRRMFARVLTSVIWLCLGAINGAVLSFRVTPFTAQDIYLVKDAVEVADAYVAPIAAVGIAAAVILLIGGLVFAWKRLPKYQKEVNYKLAVMGFVTAAAVFAGTTALALEQRVLSTYFGNIAFAYEDYGFPYCFSCTLVASGMGKPYGYSEKAVKRIATWEEETLQSQEEQEQTPNIIMLQLESFFDPTTVEFLEFSQDPIPNFRRLMEEYSSGAFNVPSIGAGTANTEFESITGMNLRYFGPGEYPYKTILQKSTCESIAYNLKSIGYTAHAVHNNDASFYDRVDVFQNLGFDTFTSKEYMDTSKMTENGWMEDQVLTGCVLDCLKSTEGPDFVYTISVQAHGEYPGSPVLENPVIQVTGADTEAENNQWEYFVNQLYEMDLFIGELIAALEAYGEDTVLAMYGDHLPTMELTVRDLSNRYLYETSYVIWDNLGLERTEGALCSYQIAAEMLDRVDLHVGTMIQYHQNRRNSKLYQPDMEMIQYDLLYGEKYLYGGENPYEPTAIQMGIKNPKK